MEIKIAKRYKLGRKIGSGSFGDIYLGKDIPTGEEVAIKLESVKTRHPQLHYESKLYRVLSADREHAPRGIPAMRWYGVEGNYNVLIMDLLGPSLEDLFNYCGRTFTVTTVCMLALELLDRVQYIHEKNFIHRDIKPDNFLIGTGKNCSTVYAIDFGLAKRYRNPKTFAHIRYREHKHLTGTPRYASVNNHLGIEQSRRDDLESLGFVLLYFLRGKLPWQGLRANTKKQKYQKILEKKLATPFKLLCKGFPVEFTKYLEYCRQLRFEDTPDYKFLKSLFEQVLRRHPENPKIFDWVKRKKDKSKSEGKGSSSSSSRKEGEVRRSSGGERLRGFDTSGGGGGHSAYVRNSSSADASGVRRSSSHLHHGHRVDSRGHRVDSRGHRVDSRGHRVDSRGHRVDSSGRRISSSRPSGRFF